MADAYEEKHEPLPWYADNRPCTLIFNGDIGTTLNLAEWNCPFMTGGKIGERKRNNEG